MLATDALRKVSIFEELEDSLLRLLTVRSRSQVVAPGEVLMSEGEEGTTLQVLIEGRVSVHRRTAGGESILIAERSAGDCFGEMSLLDGGRRSATVIAVEPCLVLVVDQNTFETIVLAHPRAAMAVLRTLVRRLRDQSEQLSEAKNHLDHLSSP